MPKVVNVNNHRFVGTNIYHTGPTALDPGGGIISAWVSPQPGILISAYPTDANPGDPTTMYRYNILTNTTTTINVTGTRPNYTYADRDRPAFASLGGGYAQSLVVVDNNDGSATVSNWIWNDSTLTWSAGAGFTIASSYSKDKSNGLYELALGKTLFEHGTQAWVYNRTANTWTSVGPMPREVWAAGKIAENLLYLAGKEDESSAGTNTYTAQSAPSFVYDAVANTWTTLGHSLELAVPPTEDFGGTRAVVTRSGQMQQFLDDGVIGIGANNRWMTYRHSLNLVSSRTRSNAVRYMQLLRPNPICWALETATTDYVYSW